MVYQRPEKIALRILDKLLSTVLQSRKEYGGCISSGTMLHYSWQPLKCKHIDNILLPQIK